MSNIEKLKENGKIIRALSEWFISQEIDTEDATMILCQMIGSLIAFHSKHDKDRLAMGVKLCTLMIEQFARDGIDVRR